MRVELILPALAEAEDPLFGLIEDALFPPLGLATLAAFLDPDDEAATPAATSRPSARTTPPTSW